MSSRSENNIEQEFSSILISKRITQEYIRQNGLKKNFTFTHLWGICVGAVISGQFIGWNNSLNYLNPFGLMCLTLLVSIFYIIIVSVLLKLSISFPYAGGPYAYSRKAFGKLPGFLAGFVTMVEYLCITTVILLYMESYIADMLGIVWPSLISLLVFFGLAGLQLLGANKSSLSELLITCLCVSIFILYFMGINSVEKNNIVPEIFFDNGIQGIFLALPYVLWFFVGIDVVTLTTEEIITPEKSLKGSFYGGIFTIIILSFGVIFFSVNNVYWPSLRDTDYPLIFILEKLQRGDVVLLTVFSFFSLSSFIASINGLMIGYSRQAFSLARAGYFPRFMDRIINKTKAPFMALIAPSFVVIVIAQVGDITTLIQIVCACALISYIFSLMAFIKITGGESSSLKLRSVAYLGLLGCLAFLTGLAIFQTWAVIITMCIIILGILYYYIFARGRINRDAPEEAEANIDEINIIVGKL